MRIFEFTLAGHTFAPSYYGLMYALAFICAYLYLRREHFLKSETLDTLMIYLFLGVVLGGRLGYVLIYNLPYYLDNPGEILQPWKGGMSFHGGLLGVIAMTALFCRRFKLGFLETIERLALIAPIGLFFGRIGNYLNKELLGLSGYSGPLAVQVGDKNYFPTPLLEASLEGIALFFLLQVVKKRLEKPGQIGSIFLVGYAGFRFLAEFTRNPDPQIGYLAFGWVTMGHVLSTIMFAVGVGLYVHFTSKKTISKK